MDLSKKFLKLSQEICDSKIAFFLEGGYDVNVLAEIVTGIISEFSSEHYELEFIDNHDQDLSGEKVIKNSLDVQKHYWDL